MSDESCVPSPWYVTTFQLVTHLPLLSAILANILGRNRTVPSGIVFAILCFVALCSITYHTCQCTCQCGWNVPLYVLQILDNIFAFGGIVVIVICLASNPLIYESIRYSSIQWGQVIYMSVFGMNLIIVVTSITGPNQGVSPDKALFLLLFAVCLLFVKILYADNGRMMLVEKFTDATVYVGFAFVFIGVACFLIEIEGSEWVTHGVWHFCIFTGITLLEIGTILTLPEPADDLFYNLQRNDAKQSSKNLDGDIRGMEMGVGRWKELV